VLTPYVRCPGGALTRSAGRSGPSSRARECDHSAIPHHSRWVLAWRLDRRRGTCLTIWSWPRRRPNMFGCAKKCLHSLARRAMQPTRGVEDLAKRGGGGAGCKFLTLTFGSTSAQVCRSAPKTGTKWARARSRRGSAACNYLRGMVGRDGIEPPTPGFSGLGPHPRKCAYLLVMQGRPVLATVCWSAPELARVALRWARFGHTSRCTLRVAGGRDYTDRVERRAPVSGCRALGNVRKGPPSRAPSSRSRPMSSASAACRVMRRAIRYSSPRCARTCFSTDPRAQGKLPVGLARDEVIGIRRARFVNFRRVGGRQSADLLAGSPILTEPDRERLVDGRLPTRCAGWTFRTSGSLRQRGEGVEENAWAACLPRPLPCSSCLPPSENTTRTRIYHRHAHVVSH